MKIDIIKSLLAIAFSVLMTYICYSVISNEENTLIYVIVSCVMFTITSILSLGVICNNDHRKSVMLKVLSGVFLGIFIVADLMFAVIGADQQMLLIANGLMLILYLLLYSSVFKSTTE